MYLSLIIPPRLAGMAATDLAAWAGAAGFAAIDSEPEHDAAWGRALAGHGLRPGPMRIRASLADSDPAARRQALDLACAGVERAAALGLDTVWTLPRNFRNDASPRANFAAARASLAELAGCAERHGVRVAIENCPFEGQNVICTPEAWDALFAAVPGPSLGLCLDPSHCVWQGIDYVRAARAYAGRIYHVHAKDAEIVGEGLFRYGVEGPRLEEPGDEDGWPRHGWWRYRLPGLGAVNWNALLTQLADGGYRGAVSAEHEDPLWGGDAGRVRRGLAQAGAYLARYIG